jgi:glycosyltransferase involved in cell wall biosynthesis
VDATWLGPHQTGAQVLTTAAVRALATRDEVSSIHLIGIDALPDYASGLAEIPKVSVGIDADVDVFWFPNQWDIRNSMAGVHAKRVITTYLDFIAYGIDSYHGSADDWKNYRELQRRVALMSDGITTISVDVAHQLAAHVPAVEHSRIRAIPLGVDHIVEATSTNESGKPLDLPEDLKPFILVLGNDFRHKNRDLAVKVWQEVLQRGHQCDLVLAGLHVRGSSSRHQEQVLLDSHVNLRGSAYRLGHVDEAERAWLLAHAAVVLYPTSAEGFGFVPFEAARLGSPSSFVSFGSLRELTGVADVPSTWSVTALADDVSLLLKDDEAADRRIGAVLQRSEELTWGRFAEEFVAFAQDVLAMPKQMSLTAVEATESRTSAPRRELRRITQRLRRWNQ